MRKPHKVDVSIDSQVDLEDLAETVAQNIVTAYIMIKGFKTLCSMVEHITVTKVK